VITNDRRNACNGSNPGSQIPLVLSSGVTLTGSSTNPNYFTILSNGNIFVDLAAGGGTTIPLGSYPLTYQVCEGTPAVCVTQTVTIIVTNSSRIAADNPKPIVKQKINTLTKQSTYQIINFPDANLKAKLLDATDENNIAFLSSNGFITRVDFNGDGEIDTNEALQIGRLQMANSNISNLTGLEYFINLSSIGLGFNNINSFNLNLPSLSILSIANNPLTNFNTQNLPNLTRFNCSNTLLTSINTTNKYLLEIVSLSDTQINTIDLGICPNLIYFYCQNNPNLTSINIKNTSLLDYNNSFMQQDCWRNCPNLNYICADSNEIPVLQSFLGNCGVNTSGITIDSACALGVDDVLLDGISIAPNPSTGIFEITFPTSLTVKTTATVYTMLGQKMMSINEVGNSTMQVDLSGYPNGTYLLQLVLDDKKVIKKLIKR